MPARGKIRQAIVCTYMATKYVTINRFAAPIIFKQLTGTSRASFSFLSLSLIYYGHS